MLDHATFNAACRTLRDTPLSPRLVAALNVVLEEVACLRHLLRQMAQAVSEGPPEEANRVLMALADEVRTRLADQET